MAEVCKELSKYPVSTRVNLSGTIIVARDIAHARMKELIEAGKGLPQYVKDHPILYAGPAKTPEGYACGSMGPTTAQRMDPYVDLFQENGGSLVMIAKGNRTQAVTDACKKHGGFYLGTIGGVAAVLSASSIKSIECVEWPELGMEAVYKIEVVDFPAFILVDDKGNDFFKQLKPRNEIKCECCKSNSLTALNSAAPLKKRSRTYKQARGPCTALQAPPASFLRPRGAFSCASYNLLLTVTNRLP